MQKQEILYSPVDKGGQGLKPWKATDTGKKQLRRHDECTNWSTDDEVLQGFPDNPVARALREYGDVHKLLSTYVLAYLGDPANDKEPQIYEDRIHADFVQYGTNTRRFSCRAPNLQNIPRPDTPLGKLIRGAWCAEPGEKLVIGDYGQIELVMFAHFAGSGALYDVFINGGDPHQMTADKLGIERQQGKRLNFSMSFGAGLYLVASMLGVSVDAAREILADHRRAFPELYQLKEDIINTCRSREPVPYVHTLLGGMRRLPEINRYAPRRAAEEDRKAIDGIRMRAERQAVSAVIQGSAADLIKLAMVRADVLLGQQIPEARLTLCVHDEIVLEVPEQYAEKAKDILEEAMTGPEIQRLIRVPLVADAKIVDRWSQAK